MCVDVEIGEAAITVNASIDFCPIEVVVDAEGNVIIGEVELDAELLNADLVDLLTTFADAGILSCLLVHVEDNEVTVDVVAQACLVSTLNEDGSLTVEFGDGVELEFVAEVVLDAEGVLEVGVATELGLQFNASVDVASDEFLLEVRVLEICGETPTEAPTMAPTEAPTMEPTAAPTGGAGPTDAVNPTMTITQPPTDGTTGSGPGSAQVLLPVMLLVVAASGLLVASARLRRTN